MTHVNVHALVQEDVPVSLVHIALENSIHFLHSAFKGTIARDFLIHLHKVERREIE
jgi:hypothetical protein